MGPASRRAPRLVVGGGFALGNAGPVRLETNVLVGVVSEWVAIPDSALRPVASARYTAARSSSDAVMIELNGSWRTGPLELWAGGGVHWSFAEVQAFECSDATCATFDDVPTFEVGSTGSGLVLGAGARLPLFDHLLVGVDLRWLAPTTSRVEHPAITADVPGGGVVATFGVVLRLGAPTPRAP